MAWPGLALQLRQNALVQARASWLRLASQTAQVTDWLARDGQLDLGHLADQADFDAEWLAENPLDGFIDEAVRALHDTADRVAELRDERD